MGEGRSKCALSKNKAAVATALHPLKGSLIPTNYKRPPRAPRRDLRSPPHFSPPPPTSAAGWEPGTGYGVPGVHLKHHLREIARENERHRLHRLGAAPDPESTASPALHAFSSSHIRGGGGRGLARGAAAARRGLAPPTPGDREGRSRAARARGRGRGRRPRWARREPELRLRGRAVATAALTVRGVAPGGPPRGGRGKEGADSDRDPLRGSVSASQRPRWRQNRTPPTSSLWGWVSPKPG